MTARQWCPSEWIDEVVPVTVADPAEAVRCFGPEEGWCLVTDEWRIAGPAERAQEVYPTIDIEPGQIVSWQYSEQRGDFMLTVAGNGAWMLDGEIPERVTHWWVTYDADTISDDLPTLAASLEPGEHEVSAYYWSDDVPMRFEIEDGKGRFVQVAGAN